MSLPRSLTYSPEPHPHLYSFPPPPATSIRALRFSPFHGFLRRKRRTSGNSGTAGSLSPRWPRYDFIRSFRRKISSFITTTVVDATVENANKDAIQTYVRSELQRLLEHSLAQEGKSTFTWRTRNFLPPIGTPKKNERRVFDGATRVLRCECSTSKGEISQTSYPALNIRFHLTRFTFDNRTPSATRRNNGALCSLSTRRYQPDSLSPSSPRSSVAIRLARPSRLVVVGRRDVEARWGKGRATRVSLNGRLHMTTMIGNETSCARGAARTGARNRLLLPREGVRSASARSRCTPSAVRGRKRKRDGERGTWTVACVWPARRWQVGMPRETRQLPPLYRERGNTCS